MKYSNIKAIFVLIAFSFSLISCDRNSNSVQPKPPVTEKPGVEETQDILELNGAKANFLKLENNLRVVVISSPTSKMASAALAVQFGSSNDPINAQGLAHYMEHMLFLGTKEFPVVGEYSQFLRSNGGSSNAYTSRDHTNYYFVIPSAQLDGAIHRFSRFFVSPLFDAEFSEKEKGAIQNEYNFRFDAFKPMRVSHAFLKTDNPMRSFAVGNKVTLADVSPEDTRTIFKENYFSEAMQLVIAGPQSLEELEGLAKKYFSDIKSEPEKALNTYDEINAYDMDLLPAVVMFKPTGEEKSISIDIPVNNPKKENQKLSRVLSHLIGDESPESLMFQLQQAGLATQGAGALSGGGSFSGVGVTVRLTEEGVKNYKEVIAYVKGYMNFLKEQGLPSYINSEVDNLEKTQLLANEFYEVSSDVTEGLNRIYMAKSQKPKEWSELFLGASYPNVTPKEYKEYLSRLNYDKMFVVLSDNRNPEVNHTFEDKGDLEQGGMDLKVIDGKRVLIDSLYKISAPIDDSVKITEIAAKGDFQIKKQNQYIPSDFTLYKENKPPHMTVTTEEWGQMYQNAFTDKNLAKTFMDLQMYSDGIDFSKPEDGVMMFLFREMLKVQTAGKTYPMVVAGSSFGFPIGSFSGSITLQFDSWTDSFSKVFGDTLGFTSLEITASEFASLKNHYAQVLKEGELARADSAGVRALYGQLSPVLLSFEDTQTTMNTIEYSQFTDFIKRYMSGLYLRGNISGNLRDGMIEQVIKTIKEKWNPGWANPQNWEALTHLKSPVLEKKELVAGEFTGPSKENDLYVGYWNFGAAKSDKEKNVASIVGQWAYPDYYEELRTQKQMAYSLYTYQSEILGSQGLFVNLLSSDFSTSEIETAVDEFFLNWAQNVLPKKPQELLDQSIQNLVLKRELPNSSGDLHSFYVGLVDDDFKSVAEYQESLAGVEDITLEDVVQYGQEKLLAPKAGVFLKVNKK